MINGLTHEVRLTEAFFKSYTCKRLDFMMMSFPRQIFSFAGLVAMSLVCVSVDFAVSQSTISQTYEKVAPAIVLITTDTGGGTGFIIKSDGIVVTALHVVDGARNVGIRTYSGEMFDDVYLLAKDERKDLAILKILGFDLPIVALGNSNRLNPGDDIIVIGNPLGKEELQASVSDGIISGIRDLGAGYKIIQLTAPISPGSSGSPVLSADGKVIGVASFKLEEGEALNFAVPINYVRGMATVLDSSKPLIKWKSSVSPEALFADNSQASFTGYWKSTRGFVFHIKDEHQQVKINASAYPDAVFYAFRQDQRVFVALHYNRGQELSHFILREIDSGHLAVAYVDWRSARLIIDGKPVINPSYLHKLGSALDRQDEIWIKME